ncbi:lytic transglycosylase domain-containing protein [Paraburkholderia silviterrae]|uniref:Lytic transglycosylase domain-containing protein n=1 Tax=Paraburkholderia silviterrae TaxID=2528715 RepID=A0A4R5M1X9_9BURK|nr:lytic transglycosylase domain-containing protein [Paraburkholderia silviterrae]TDG19359.1 lytic transglycosylase domain-containing protein [Paraburkholderia silviterrae]
MYAKLKRELGDWPRAMAYRLSSIILAAAIVIFGSQAGLCYGADAPAWTTPNHAVDVPQESAPTAEEIASFVNARFHIGLRNALEIGYAVLNAARRYTISPLLLLAVIAVESSFDRFAVSVVGARGLMQVLPSQHRDLVLRTSDLNDARTNVRIGSAILQDYIRASDGNLDDALYRYSGGAKDYARRVVDHMSMMKAQFGL